MRNLQEKFLAFTFIILAFYSLSPALAKSRSKIYDIEERIQEQRTRIDEDVDKSKLSHLDSMGFKARQDAIRTRAEVNKELNHGRLTKEEYKKLSKDLDRIEKEIEKYEKGK